MARPKRRKRKLGVVVGQFPSTSELFILRELLQLKRRGFPLVILSLDRPEGEALPSRADELIESAIYRAPPLSAASLFAQFFTFLCNPTGYASAAALALRKAIQNPAAVRELVSSLLAAGYLATAARRQNLGHIHAQFGSKPATVGLLLAEILGITLSISLHARDIFTDESILLREKLTEAEFSTVCNEHGLERLRRQYRLLGHDKLHLIHHGIEPSRFVRVVEPSSEPRMLLSVGRLVEKKGFDILLRAAAQARANGAEFSLEIVGDGPEMQDLQRLMRGLALNDITTFHGAIPQEDLIGIYRDAYAFALASIVTADGDRDGIPNVIIEALAMGIPTVASRTGGIPELIVHEETGLLVSPGDAGDLANGIERILYDEQLRARVSEAGKRKVLEEFDAARNVDQLVGLLMEYVQPREEVNT